MSTDLSTIRAEADRETGRAAELLSRYHALEIRDHAASVAVAEELKTIKTASREIAAKEDAILSPMKQAMAEVKALFEKPKALLATAERTLKAKVAEWQDAERRRVEEERRRAEEIARKERARLAAEAEKARREAEAKAQKIAEGQGTARTAAAVERLEQKAQDLALMSAMTVAPPVLGPSKVEGVSTRTTWSAEVTDAMALIRAVAEGKAPPHLVTPNMAELNKLARAMKEHLAIPGVRAVAQDVVSVRTAL